MRLHSTQRQNIKIWYLLYELTWLILIEYRDSKLTLILDNSHLDSPKDKLTFGWIYRLIGDDINIYEDIKKISVFWLRNSKTIEMFKISQIGFSLDKFNEEESINNSAFIKKSESEFDDIDNFLDIPMNGNNKCKSNHLLFYCEKISNSVKLHWWGWKAKLDRYLTLFWEMTVMTSKSDTIIKFLREMIIFIANSSLLYKN